MMIIPSCAATSYQAPPTSIGAGNGPEIKLAFTFLIEHAIASGAAAAHVHPIGRHDDD
jgi:hypothetical protein